MWATVELGDDVAAAVEQLRTDHCLSISAAVNELARRGLAKGQARSARFVQQTSSGGARLGMTDVADALDLMDRPGSQRSSM